MTWSGSVPVLHQMFEDRIPAVQLDESQRLRIYDIAELRGVFGVDRPRAQFQAAGDISDD